MIEVPGLKKVARDGSPLAPYQLAGMEHLARAKRSFLCDEVGLGKTVQALGAVRFLDAFPLVVACPGFARPVWMSEIEWWLGDAVTVQRLDTGGTIVPPQSNRHILVASFDSIGKHLGMIAGALRPKAVIVDEAHYVKNFGTKRTKATKQLAKGAYVVYCLTATPIENRPAEFAPQLEIMRREHDVGGKNGTWGFLQQFCVPPESRIWRGDFSFAPIGEVKPGDEVIGWQKPEGGKGGKCRRLRRATVEVVTRRTAPLIKLTMASGRTIRCTADHKWLSASHGGAGHNEIFIEPKVGKKLRLFIEPTPPLVDPLKIKDAFWLGGMYDGEGGWKIAQSPPNPVLYEEIDAALHRLGLLTTRDANGIRLRGGRQAMVNFLNWAQPRKRGRWTDRFVIGDSYGYSGGTAARIANDEIVGISADGWSEVVALTTSTGNYVVEGYASKNCNNRGYGIAAGVNPHTGRSYFDFTGARDLPRLLAVMKDASCYLRRRKADVQQELPEKRMVILPVRIENRDEYDAAEKNVVAWKLANEGHAAADRAFQAEALVKMEVLKQLAVKGKWTQAQEWIETFVESGEKLVVFTSHVNSLKRLVNTFPKGVAAGLGGDVPLDERERIITRFRDDPKLLLLVANLRAGGVAIDLTAASTVAFLELGWTASAHEQAEGRLHRQGQRRAVTAYYLLAQGTVEEDIHRLIEGKRRMMAEALDGISPAEHSAPIWLDVLWKLGRGTG
jgi:superfamily II DNA or RNA helicase